MYQHSCIKCGTAYSNEDPDPYYCDPCDAQRKQVAREVDAKLKRETRPTKSAIQEYDEAPKIHGFLHVKL